MHHGFIVFSNSTGPQQGQLISTVPNLFKIKDTWDFPGDAVVKNPPANAWDMGSSPDQGRAHMPQSN